MGAAIFNPGSPNSAFGSCAYCTSVDAGDWLFCLGAENYQSQASGPSKRKRRAKDSYADQSNEVDPRRLEELIRELFAAHDLNDDGLLQESELVTLNERIAVLHHGKQGAEVQTIRETYRQLFRTKLDPHGRPVAFDVFQKYARELVNELDNDPEAQEMILEQFVAEAKSGRQAMDLISVISDSRTLEQRMAEIPSRPLPDSSPLPPGSAFSTRGQALDRGDTPLVPGTGHRSADGLQTAGQVVYTAALASAALNLPPANGAPVEVGLHSNVSSREPSRDAPSQGLLGLGFESRLVCRKEDLVGVDPSHVKAPIPLHLVEGI